LDDGYISFRPALVGQADSSRFPGKFVWALMRGSGRFDYEGGIPGNDHISRLNPLLALPFDFDVIEEGAAAAIQVLDPARSIFVPDSFRAT